MWRLPSGLLRLRSGEMLDCKCLLESALQSLIPVRIKLTDR